MSLIDDLKKKWESALNPEPYVQEMAEEALVGDNPIKEDDIYNPILKAPAEAPAVEEAPAENAIEGTSMAQLPTNPFKPGFYETAFGKLNKDIVPETEEEKYIREKREYSRNRLFNFADIGAHIANMWGAQGGATAIDVSSMTDAHRKRMDIAKEARDRNNDAYSRGMFQALAMDQQTNVAEQARAQKAAERQEDISYREKQDEQKLEQQRQANAMALLKLDRDMMFKEAKLELDEKKNARDEKVANARVGQLNAQARSYSLKTPEGKSVTYTPTNYYIEYDSTFNGVPVKKPLVVEIPKELKGSYVSIVFNKMVEVAQVRDDERTTALREGEKSNEQMIRETFAGFSEGSQEPTSSKMETAMLTHAASLGLQGFMDDQARRMTKSYINHLDKPDRTEGVSVHNIEVPIEAPAGAMIGGLGIGLSKEDAQKMSDLGVTIVE